MDNSARQNLHYFYRKINSQNTQVLFDSFEDFARWSMKNGYEYGMRLRRRDEKREWSPDNAEWVDTEKVDHKEYQKAVKKWDDFITPIRNRYRNELEKIREEEQKKIENGIHKATI